MSVSCYLQLHLNFIVDTVLKTRICPIIQPHSISVTHFNSQAQQPNQKLASHLVSSLLYLWHGSYRSAALAYVHTSHSDYALGSLFSWGSSPFWNMKGPGELEHSAMERMNHSRTINHLSLDAIHTRACNNNSFTLTMAFCDVFCLKRILLETGESNDFMMHKNQGCCPQTICRWCLSCLWWWFIIFSFRNQGVIRGMKQVFLFPVFSGISVDPK